MWENELAYPKNMRYQHPQLSRLLDDVESLLPLDTTIVDRYSRVAQWLEEARDKGLVTRFEFNDLRTAIAPLL